jgi:hypothetical protein
MTATDILRANGIAVKDGAQYGTTCPRCSHTRSNGNRKAECLRVKIDAKGACWRCHHCEWEGPEKGAGKKSNDYAGDSSFVAVYDYVDENATLLFQVCRKPNKDFPQRRPDGKGGWIWDTKDVRKVLYRLPELIEAVSQDRTILIVEGEKDANNIWKLGLPATCSPGGAPKPTPRQPNPRPKWRREYSETLRNADIVIIPDNDPAGRLHAEQTAQISVGIAKRVRVLDLAKHWLDMPAKKDTSDWLELGHTREELDALIEATPPFIPDTEAPPIQPGEAPSPRFKLIPFEELKPNPAPDYLIKGLIPRAGIVVLWGEPKSLKSFWATAAGLHVALAWPYHERKVTSGPVIYCAFEGAAGHGKRAEAFRQRHLTDHKAPVPFKLMPASMDLVKDHRQFIAEVAAQLGGQKPIALFLDTLNRSLAGSESSDEDMGLYVRAADAIREAFDCVVIIVHHCGIDKSRPRGHTSLGGAVDAQLACRRAGDTVSVEVEWMKDGPEGESITSRLEVVQVDIDADGDPITSCVLVPADAAGAAEQKQTTGAAKIALDLLYLAIAETGEAPPASNHIPPQVGRTCRTATWRSYCYKGTVAESDNPDTKQKAFVRACEKLQGLGLIGIWGDYVWVIGHAGRAQA